ncbi:UDP-N-acetylglucosamine--N-acetylmuramyl-(pentapeptide) pyrophosphoryl-undecaprenol N-acetylglucosamine transferase, partial [Vibrio parahaemolyticus]
RAKPQAVLGVGGYASGPLVLMAKLLGRRTAILEQSSVPGLTNRILGKLVDTVFCAFPGTEKSVPGKRTVLTGNPIRAAIKPLASAS